MYFKHILCLVRWKEKEKGIETKQKKKKQKNRVGEKEQISPAYSPAYSGKRRGKRREREGGGGWGVGWAIENYQQLAYIQNQKQKQKENNRLTEPPLSLNSKGEVTFLTTLTLAYGKALLTFDEKWLLRSVVSMSTEECRWALSDANLSSRQSIWVQIKWEKEREDRVVPIPPPPPLNFFVVCVDTMSTVLSLSPNFFSLTDI